MASGLGIARHRSALLEFLPWLLIAAAPIIFALATWDTAGVHPGIRDWVRQTGAPVVAIEIAVILMAIVRGDEPLALLNRQPIWVRLCLLGVVSVAVATSLWVAQDPIRAITWTFIWSVHLLFGLSVFCLGRDLGPQTRRAVWASLVIGLCAYALLVILFVYSVPKGVRFNWERFPLAGSNVRHIAYYAVIGASAGAALALSGTGRARILGSAAMILLLALAFWSGSRGAVIAVWAAFALGMFWFRQLRKPWAWAMLFGLTALAAAISVLAPVPNGLFGLHRAVSTMQAPSANTFSSGRLEMWADSWRAVLRAPWFGYGQGQFPHVVASQHLFNQPHNIGLQLLLQWGCVGTGLTAALAGYVALRCRDSLRRPSPSQLPAFLVAAAMFVMALYDATLFYSYPTMIFVFSMALLIVSAGGDRVHPTRT